MMLKPILDTMMNAQEQVARPLGYWPDKSRTEVCHYCEREFHPAAENQRLDSAGHFSHWQCDNCIEKQQMYGSEW